MKLSIEMHSIGATRLPMPRPFSDFIRPQEPNRIIFLQLVLLRYNTASPVKEAPMPVMIKVKCPADQRTEILQITEHFKGDTVDLTEDTIMIQVTGSSEMLDSMMVMLEKFSIIETVRSGKLIMARGHEST